jgi:signal transduction histidine kinase
MRSLYLRIYLTVLLALGLFALVSGWLVQRQFDQERARFVASAQERAAAWGDLLQRSLPGADAPPAEQAAALSEWSNRLRLPLALDDADGKRIGASEAYLRREQDDAPEPRRAQAVRLEDGRTLWIMRPQLRPGGPGRAGMDGGMRMDRGMHMDRGMQMDGGTRMGAGMRPGARPGPPDAAPLSWWTALAAPGGLGVAALLLVLFVAVAAGAWPVVRRLTRRLEALKQGVEAFGAGALDHRVAEDGRDEVAALGASFNRAAERIEALLRSQQSLLANASHELRSPLARLKMAVSMLGDAPAAQREGLQREIHANIGELDALVEEVLLASRLEAGAALQRKDPVELLALAAEEASRIQARVEGQTVQVAGDERLLRRALRNLLENAHRYGVDSVSVGVQRNAAGQAEVLVCDRGPGVPEAYRERIFEAFFRLPGHAERAGGVGLGLALVRQIATAHGGSVGCEPREGGGSCFRLSLPAA